jgi:hypothetical protein
MGVNRNRHGRYEREWVTAADVYLAIKKRPGKLQGGAVDLTGLTEALLFK